MNETEMLVKGFALVGVFYVLRGAAMLVLRMDGYDVENHRQRYLTLAVAVATLGIGWLSWNVGETPRHHPLAQDLDSNSIVRKAIVSRESSLLSDRPVALDVEPIRPFVFEEKSVEAGVYLSTSADSEGTHYELPTVSLDDLDELQARRIEVAANHFKNRKRQPAPQASESVSMLWDEPLIRLDAEQVEPFEFVQLDVERLKPTRFARIIEPVELPSIIISGGIWSGTEEKKRNQGATDIPGAPSQQIEDMMRATPGFYEQIPEVHRFLNRQ